MSKNINSRYKREREVMAKLSDKIIPIAFSGGNWRHGYEDGQSEEMIVQVKSTRTNTISVSYDTLCDLLMHAHLPQVPVFVLDFASPTHGTLQLPEDIWVAMPLVYFQQVALPSIEKQESNSEEGGDCPSTERNNN